MLEISKEFNELFKAYNNCQAVLGWKIGEVDEELLKKFSKRLTERMNELIKMNEERLTK